MTEDSFNEIAAKQRAKVLLQTKKQEAAQKPGKSRKKIRREQEQRFLGAVLSEAYYGGDIREKVERYAISWRYFIDKRHQALWRALEVLDLHSIDERMDILEKEAYTCAPAATLMDAAGDDLVRGEEGSAASKQFRKKLIEESTGIIWVERELEAAGALALVGGKVYLREIAEIGGAELMRPEELAKRLFRR